MHRLVEFEHRRIDVVIGEIVGDAEQLLAQFQIAVEHGKPRVRLGDELAIDGFGHVVGEQRVGERIGIAAHLGVEFLR